MFSFAYFGPSTVCYCTVLLKLFCFVCVCVVALGIGFVSSVCLCSCCVLDLQRRGGCTSHFMLGVAVKDDLSAHPKKFRSFCKVSAFLLFMCVLFWEKQRLLCSSHLDYDFSLPSLSLLPLFIRTLPRRFPLFPGTALLLTATAYLALSVHDLTAASIALCATFSVARCISLNVPAIICHCNCIVVFSVAVFVPCLSQILDVSAADGEWLWAF